MFGVVQLLSSSVTVCGAAPVLVNAMAWPTLAVMVLGSNSKSLIEAVTSPGAVASCEAAPAAGADASAGALAAALGAVVALPPEHAARTRVMSADRLRV